MLFAVVQLHLEVPLQMLLHESVDLEQLFLDSSKFLQGKVWQSISASP